jgi:hypothetical protein
MRSQVAAAALAISACGQPADRQMASNTSRQANVAATETSPIPPPGTGPDARTPLAEPNGAIELKSIEAAGQVVQHYGALIEQGRYREAEKLWENDEAASAFTKELHPHTHLEIGELGGTEGAAGSIYATVPVVVYGNSYRRPANVILRRVNDVPGSTEVQRRWHIERIDWSGPT